LQQLGLAGQAAHITLVPRGHDKNESQIRAPTSVSLFDQGLVQVLQASVTGLEPKHAYVLALTSQPDGSGLFQPLASFTTNPAGSAIVDAIGPIRQIVQPEDQAPRRYLAVAPGTADDHGLPVQVQGE
jgi:hypothetical protein